MTRASVSTLLVMLAALGVGLADVDPDPRSTLTAESLHETALRVRPGEDLTPASWPGGKRVAVALTFDVDLELVWMGAGSPESHSPARLLRGHYGLRAGLTRVLEMLDRRAVPATFFIPALNIDAHPEILERVRANPNHEFGYHGYAHERLTTLTARQENEALRSGLAILKRHGIVPKVFRAPAWDLNDRTLTLLAEHGFVADSSLMGDDRPHMLMIGGRPAGIVELPVDWSLDDWPFFQVDWSTPMIGLRDPEEVASIWMQEFEGIRDDGGVFVLTLHPQVIGRWSRIRMLERFVERLQADGDAWFATLSEIVSHLRRAAPAE